ncbi:uncharacterized protein LOC115810685 [Chanos chanos]|uniref:Uncharacterized protein LOC115810685 n=1 Tax=Chanos chanos TaxID=29144 RepID=A0A6J2V9V7_CHACN|nr:uncharacterized protein LOC115810685 [Chanos chanos]
MYRNTAFLHVVTFQDVCRSSELKYEEPEILSVEPNVISFHGRNNVRLRGKNLNSVTKVRVQWDLDCNPKDSPVLQRSSDNLIFHIPGGIKGTARVCVVMPDGGCHGNTAIFYGSQPSCTNMQPRKSWASGNRSIQVVGSNLEFVEAITLNDYTTDVSFSSGVLRFQTPPLIVFTDSGPFPVLLKAGNKSLACQEKLLYHPDPEFTSFTTSPRVNELLVTIQKKADSLTLNDTEIKVWGRKEEDEWRPCVNVKLESSTDKAVVLCTINNTQDVKIDSLKEEIGHYSIILKMEQNGQYMYIFIMIIFDLLIGAIDISTWMREHHLQLNPSKTDLLVIPANQSIHHNINIKIASSSLIPTKVVRNLGVMIDDWLSFSDHVASVFRSCCFTLYDIRKISPYLTHYATQLLVQAMVISQLDYCNALLVGLPACTMKALQMVQNAAPHLDFIFPSESSISWLIMNKSIQP